MRIYKRDISKFIILSAPNYRDNFKIKKLSSFFILKFYHSNGRRTLILRKL